MALYHSARGSVNYTIVGSPTIVDGVVSGFSSSDYLSMQNNIPTTSDILYNIKFTTGPDFPGVMILARHSAFGGPRISQSGDFGYTIYHFEQGAEKSTTFYLSGTSNRLQVNTTYVGGCGIKDNKYFIRLFNSSGTLIVEEENNFEYEVATASQTIGRPSTIAFNGSIDLNETYIKVNGQPWFGICPVEVKKHQLMGPVGYSLVGSPTITDGIASDFSGTDYVETSQVLETGQQDTFEFKTKFVKTASGSLPLFFNDGRFVCSGDSGQPPYIALRNSGENQTSYGAWADFKGTAAEAFATNTPYWVKMGHDGSYIYLDVSTDGTNYTHWISVPTNVSSGAAADWVAPTVTGSPQTALGFAPTSYYLHGTMDLNETSITKNGKLWFWQPRQTEKIVVNGVEVWSRSQ